MLLLEYTQTHAHTDIHTYNNNNNNNSNNNNNYNVNHNFNYDNLYHDFEYQNNNYYYNHYNDDHYNYYDEYDNNNQEGLFIEKFYLLSLFQTTTTEMIEVNGASMRSLQPHAVKRSACGTLREIREAKTIQSWGRREGSWMMDPWV